MATVSFLASRAIPAGGFLIALSGGVALARAGQREGPRRGYGASIAAVLETTATMGPARFNVPLTQALTAPLLGRLESRGVGWPVQATACALIRLLHNAAVSAFFVVVIAGGVDAYVAAFEALVGWAVSVPIGPAVALGTLTVGLLAWSVSASTVQVLVYRRGLASWPPTAGEPLAPHPGSEGEPGRVTSRRFDPRAAAIAAAIAFVVLLPSTRWTPLAVVAVWLALAYLAARVDTEPLPVGVLLALVLGLGALAIGVLGGAGVDAALRRGLRAAMLVLAATWLRAAAGDAGLREVLRRVLGRARWLPSVAEALRILDGLGSQRRLLRSAQALRDRVAVVPKRPAKLLGAALHWVAHESARRPVAPAPRPALSIRALDGLLVASAALMVTGHVL